MVNVGDTYKRNDTRDGTSLLVITRVDEGEGRVYYKNKAGATTSAKLSLFDTKSKRGYTLVKAAPKTQAVAQ